MASLVYKITGKHDDKGIKDAEKSLKTLVTRFKDTSNKVNESFNKVNESFNKVNGAIQGFIGVEIFKKVAGAIGECNKAYLEFSQKTNSIESSFLKYNKQLKEMEGLTNSVKVNIGKMFSGISSNLLDWVIPKLEEIAAWVERRTKGTMTEEEVRKKYKTMEVTYNRAKDNMKTEVANSPDIQKQRSQGVPENVIENIINEIVKRELAESAKELDDNDEMKQLFTMGYEKFIKSIIGEMDSQGKIARDFNVNDYIVPEEDKGKPKEPKELKLGNYDKSIIPFIFQPPEDDIWEHMNTEYIQSMRDAIDQTTANATSGFETISTRFDELLKSVDSEWGNTFKTTFKNATDASKDAQYNIQVYDKLLKETTDPDQAQRYYDMLQDNLKILDQATGELTYSIKQLEDEDNVAAKIKNTMENIKDTVLSGLGDVGSAIQGFITGGPLGAIAALVGQMIAPIMAIENVGAVFNTITTIVTQLAETLGLILNEMLAPLVIILQLIGEVIGMVLAPIFGALTTFITPILNIVIQIITVLKPVIMLIGQLLGLFLRFNTIMNLMSIGIQILFGAIAAVYNYVIMPIANVIIQIIGFIANAIANVANFIINILNHLPGVNIRKVSGIDTEAMKLQKIDMNTTAEEHQNTSGYGSESTGISTSGSGSYSAAKDIIVNIYFNNSYVNGDARQIALSLKAELEAVGALGY